MDTLVSVSDAIRTICRHSYGPSGEEVLVFAPPDPPLITADGHTVLRARRQQDDAIARSPFERAILDAAEGVYREVGDGTTQFVILLHGLLAHIVEHSDGADAVAARVKMARAVGTIRHQWDTRQLIPAHVERLMTIEESIAAETMQNDQWRPSTSTIKRIEQLLTTALNGALGRQVRSLFVQLVLDWVFQSEFSPGTKDRRVPTIYRRLQSFLRRAPSAVIHAQGAFPSSHVVPCTDFILRKSLLPSQLPTLLLPLKATSTKTLRFVCFAGNLDPTCGSNQIIYTPVTGANPNQALDGLRCTVTDFIASLRQLHDVRLLVTTEKVDDYITAACSQHCIACVQYAEREDVEALCSIAGISPLASVFDSIDGDQHVGTCERGVSVVRFLQTPFLHLRGITRRAAHGYTEIREVVPQIILYASSKGVYKQHYSALLKSLRVVRSIFTSDNPCSSIQICRGAGATELSIAKALQKEVQRTTQEASSGSEVSIRLAKQALATALVASVAQLRANTTQGGRPSSTSLFNSNRQSARVLLDEMSRLEVSSNAPSSGYILDMNHAISTKLGCVYAPTLVVGDPLVFGVIHPWQRMVMIIHSVLQTAEMLLRVEMVVRVKRNPEIQETGLHENLDEESESKL